MFTYKKRKYNLLMKKTRPFCSFALFFLFMLLVNSCGPITSIPQSATSTNIVPVPPINPDFEAITVENIDKLEQVNALGLGRVYGYAVSLDKSKIAIYVNDEIKIYDTETLTEKQTITAGKYKSQNDLRRDSWSILTFSQDGETLAFTDGYWVSVWDISTNQRINRFPSLVPNWSVVSITFSPNAGQLVLTTLGGSLRCDGRDMNFALYNLDGQLLFDQYSCADYSNNYYEFVSDDKVYFVFSSIMTDKFPSRFYLVEVENGTLLESSAYDYDADPSITQTVLYDVSPDGKILAYALYGNEKPITKLVDYSTRETIEVLDGLVEFLYADNKVIWQARNIALAISEQDLESKKCGLENIHPVDNYKELFVNKSLAILLVSHFGKFAYLDLFDLDACQTIKRISYPASESAIFSSDGRWLATSDGFNAYVWDMKNGNLQLSVFGKPIDEPKDIIQFNADGTRFVVSSFGRDYYHPYQPYRNYTISVFDIESGNLVKLIEPESEFLYSVVPSPNKDIIMANDSEGFHFWNIETGQLVSTIPCGAYVFNPNNSQIWVAPQEKAVSPSAGKIFIYDYMTGEAVREFASVTAYWIRGLYLNSDNKKLMAHLFMRQGKDKGDAIAIFDIESGEETVWYYLPWDDYELTALGDMFATDGSKGYVHLWGYESNDPKLVLLASRKNRKISDSYDDFFEFDSYADVKFFSGEILFTGNDLLRFWSVTSGVLLTEVKPDYDVTDLVFSPDKSIMVAIGNDGVIRLWGVPKR